jgi:hypothetical protein
MRAIGVPGSHGSWGCRRLGSRGCRGHESACVCVRQVCQTFVQDVLRPLYQSEVGVLAYGPMLGHSWVTGCTFTIDKTGWVFPVMNVKETFPSIVTDALKAMMRLCKMCGLDVIDDTRRPHTVAGCALWSVRAGPCL